MREGSREWLDRPMLKALAKGKLRGKLLACFAACLLPMLLPWAMRLVPSNIGVTYFLLADLYIVGVSVPMTALSFVAAIFVTDVMQVRLAGYFLALREGEEKPASPLTVCDCFGADYWPNMRAMLLRTAYICAFTLPFAAAWLVGGVYLLSIPMLAAIGWQWKTYILRDRTFCAGLSMAVLLVCYGALLLI